MLIKESQGRFEYGQGEGEFKARLPGQRWYMNGFQGFGVDSGSPLADSDCSALAAVYSQDQLNLVGCSGTTSALVGSAPDDMCTAAAGVLTQDKLDAICPPAGQYTSKVGAGAGGGAPAGGGGTGNVVATIVTDFDRILKSFLPQKTPPALKKPASSMWLPLTALAAAAGVGLIVLSNQKKRRRY